MFLFETPFWKRAVLNLFISSVWCSSDILYDLIVNVFLIIIVYKLVVWIWLSIRVCVCCFSVNCVSVLKCQLLFSSQWHQEKVIDFELLPSLWTSFRLSVSSNRSSSYSLPCGHITQISSMYRNQSFCQWIPCVIQCVFSSKKIAITGARYSCL